LTQIELTKAGIVSQARSLGAEFVGFAPVGRWEEHGDVPAAFHPHRFWAGAKTVIVLGAPLWLPIMEAAPSVLGREQSIVTNDLLDEVAYRLAVWLNRSGQPAVNISHDGDEEGIRREDPATIFSHVWAGQYAGLGNVGKNHALLTQEYGPRLHLASVFTAQELDGDALIEEDLCNHCLRCQKICPARALLGDQDRKYAKLDQAACLNYDKRLQRAFREPCGACLKVCPVGEDRKLFQSNNFQKYFEERKILAKNPAAEEYRDWVHIRSYGSLPLEGDPGQTL